MSKHAYLIIAHTDMQALMSLLCSVDDERNIIFVHADKAWESFDPSLIKKFVCRAEIHILEERIRVRWGGVSLVRAELALMEAAVSWGGWSYCHLLSGQDVCIKTQDEIHAFFEANSGKEFLTFCGKDWNEKAQERVRYYYPEVGRNKFGRFFANVGKKVQEMIRVDRRKHDRVQWVGGSEWASLTYQFSEFLVAHKTEILKRLRGTFCSDELYKQTVAFNTDFKDKIYLFHIAEENDDTDPRMDLANMRLIDWVRGGPYTFTDEDLTELLSSPYMFARKASTSLSQKITELLRGENHE